MSETNGNGRERPASPILMELIGLKLAQLIEAGAKDANLPTGSRLDLGRGVWTLPDAVPPADP